MVNFIDSNIIGDTIRSNEDKNRQLALQEMERRNRIRQDELQRGVAGIYAEDAPTATAESPAEPNYGIAPVTPQSGTGQRGSSLSGFTAPDAIPTERGATRTVPVDTRAQRAAQLAASTPGGGQLAMQIAQNKMAGESAARKAQDAKADKVLELLAAGNVQGAKQYAEFYNLQSVLPMFSNPRAITSVQSLAAFAKSQGADIVQISGFVNTAMGAMAQGASYDEAFSAAYAELQNAPGKAAHYSTDDAGNVTAYDAYGRKVKLEGGGVGAGKRTRTGGGGSAGGSNSVQRTYPGADGFMYATMRYPDANGMPITKQLVDAQGRPVRAADVSKLAGQIYLKSLDDPLRDASIPDARSAATGVYGEDTAPAPKVRKYVPGRGFVSE